MAKQLDLDYESIKANLKTHFESQAEFTDYDFDGSALSVLIDALAYATHYNALIANFAHSETFLDSAQIRKNVISRAKELNYFPRQVSAAKATVTLTITPDVNPNESIVIQKGTKFTSVIDGETYTFVTTDTAYLNETAPSSGIYTGSVDITQGVYQTQSFVRDINIPNQRFIMNQDDIDVKEDYFDVSVESYNGSGDFTFYTRTNSIVDIDGESTVYFIQEAENGNVEIYFGDGVLGKKLQNKNFIKVEYLATKGRAANGCSQFSIIESVTGPKGATYQPSDFNVDTTNKATGGDDEESLDSIRFNAPLFNSAQERAVTSGDYKSLLMNKFPAIESVNVWGGEDNEPPIYGAVLVAIKPNYGLALTDRDKLTIQEEIFKKYAVIGITPSIVDPEYTYIDINTKVTYDDEKTIYKIGEVENLINESLGDYFTIANISIFSTDFRFSKLVSYIDAIEPSIVGNITDLTFTKKNSIYNSTIFTKALNFNVGIEPGSLKTAVWTGSDSVTKFELKDDSNGKVFVYRDGVKEGDDGVGTINYETGSVLFTTFTPDCDSNSRLILTITPTVFDVITKANNVLIQGDVTVDVEQVIYE